MKFNSCLTRWKSSAELASRYKSFANTGGINGSVAIEETGGPGSSEVTS